MTALRTVAIGPSRVRVAKILCVAKNYEDHAREMNSRLPDAPIFFLKPRTSLLSDGGTVLLPPESTRVEVETELAAILGRGGCDVERDDAMDLVAGYAVFFDITGRDLQAQARKDGSPWTAAKGFDTFATVSDAVAASKVRDPHALPIRLRVNGVIRQDSTTSKMVFGIPSLIAAASRIATLERGDIPATGTPAGVWPIAVGDMLDAEIPGVGRLPCDVAARNR